MTNTELLDNLYELSRKNENSIAVDLIAEEMNKAFLTNEFDKINLLLKMVNINLLNTSLRYALLMYANFAQDELPFYKIFYNKAVASVEGTNQEELFKAFEPKSA